MIVTGMTVSKDHTENEPIIVLLPYYSPTSENQYQITLKTEQIL